MRIEDIYVLKGAKDLIEDKESLEMCEGVNFIIVQALKKSDEKLYLTLQGLLTNLAITKNDIAIWIGYRAIVLI
ncbi:MAG: hypothetical protein ACK5LM_06790 [Lactovum sp.]